MTYYNTELIQESASNTQEHPPITAPILGVSLSFIWILDRAWESRHTQTHVPRLTNRVFIGEQATS